MKKSTTIAMFACSMLAACTTTARMDWVAVGGSKADGQVILGIDVPAKNFVSETHVDYSIIQANEEADRRCKNWGYTGSESFNGSMPVNVRCYAQGSSPCWSKSLRILYQCIDGKAK